MSAPRSDTVARMLLAGLSLEDISYELSAELSEVEAAIRRRFETLIKRRKSGRK